MVMPSRDPRGRFLPNSSTSTKPRSRSKSKSPTRKPHPHSISSGSAGASPATSRGTTEVVFVLDESGSMSTFKDDLQKNLQSILETMKKDSQSSGRVNNYSIMSFNYQGTAKWLEFRNQNPTGKIIFTPNGLTALFDATMKVADVEKVAEALPVKPCYLVYILTDGIENNSITRQEDLIKKMSSWQSTDRWTFAILCPKGYAAGLERLGFHRGNIKEWEQTTAGFQEATNTIAQSVSTYSLSRSTGQTSTQSLFANVSSPSDVEKLPDVTVNFHQWTVKDQASIEAFVLTKIGSYVQGRAFYKLTKSSGEKVQEGKEIVFRRKTDKRLFSGPNARKILGMPPTGDVKLKPGYHRNFDIFIQSTSNNRILPRDQEILYRIW